MDFYKEQRKALSKAVCTALDVAEDELNSLNVVFEVPQNPLNGEYSTNAAMVLCKKFRTSPKVLADKIIETLKKSDLYCEVWLALPGFINVRFAPAVWDKYLFGIQAAADSWGNTDIGEGRKTNLEFVSANPTGPLHIGHCRGAVIGNALAKILTKAGYDVTKEYYVNDHGNQIITLTNSLIYRYEEQFGAHKNEEHPAEFYPGDYLIDAAKTIAEKYGSQFLKGKTSLVAAEHTATFRSLAINMMLDLIRADLASLGIIFDVFSSEAALVNAGKVQDSFAVLDKLNLTRVGVLPRPMGYDGDEDAEYEEKEQLLFKSTLFGDASDRVIKKSDGTLTYFASDIAYHYDKFKRGFDLLIDVWGADHGGYVPRITSAVTEITEKGAELNVVLCQMVNLLKEGKPFKMSKRAGNFIMVSDIGELVPLDILKFYMLSRSPDSQISFDFDEVVNQSEDNLVYYIQYASARAVNVEKKYLEVFNAAPSYNTADYYQNASEQERALSREILRFPEIIVKAARTFGPQYVVEYLLKLSRTFHALYTGVGGVRVTFVDKDDRAMSDKRLTLIQAFRSTIASALTCLGITPANFLSR